MPNYMSVVMADETDFRGEFKILTDSNAELLTIGISQQKLFIGFAIIFILLFVCLIVVTVLVLVHLSEILDIEKLGAALFGSVG